jgi:esterase
VVYVLDLRNYGQSSHADSMTYAEMAADVAKFLQQQGLDKVLVLGHSMGGKVAMQLALDQPESVRALVVADIAPVSYEGEHDRIFDGLCAIDLEVIQSRADADTILADYVDDELVRQFLLSNLVRDSGAGGQFQWRINLPVLRECYDALRAAPQSEGSYPGPVLFLRGDRSNYVQADHREIILRLFPRAELKTLMQAGHWLHAEKPDSFNRLVSEFLARQSRGDAA